jgi:protein-disulfide isomerase
MSIRAPLHRDASLANGMTRAASLEAGEHARRSNVRERRLSQRVAPNHCRRFEQIQKEVLAAEPGQLRIVFHYLPLSIHPWARPAALGAACAMLQSNEAFWLVHDKLFENQTAITPENVTSKILEFAAQSKVLDLKTFKSCMDNEMSLGLVLRDINLASSNQISGTPTLFINGRGIQGVKDSAELSRLIAEAKASAFANKAVASSQLANTTR